MQPGATNGHDNSPDAGQLVDLVQACLKEAASLGATAAEAGASHDQGISVNVRLGEVETIEYQRDRSLGVTVYFGQRKGTASTADFSLGAIKETVAAACRIAKFTTEDPCVGLAEPDLLASEFPDLDLDHPWGIEPEAAIVIAQRAETAARDADVRIINSEGASCSSHRSQRCYGNSHGFLGASAGTHHSVTCVVIAGADGEMQRDWWYTTSREASSLQSPEAVGAMAAERALRRLGSRKIKTQRAPVLFSPEVSRSLFSHFLGAIRGASQYRKSSFLLGADGKQVLPTHVTVIENPLLVRGPASTAFDNEGVTTRVNTIVENGVLQGYLLDSYSARRLGLRSTGHAGGWTNVSVTGEFAQQELLQKMGNGLLVTELMGQGVNMVTGDYSRGAAGFWVENGVVVHPVEEITIAGNLGEMLLNLVAVGGDRDTRHALQVGSVLIEDLAIAGD